MATFTAGCLIGVTRHNGARPLLFNARQVSGVVRSNPTTVATARRLAAGTLRRGYSLNTRMEGARLREHAVDIFLAAVKSVLPQAMVASALQLDGNVLTIGGDRRYTLNRNVHVVAFGKAVIGMVRTAEDILGEHIVGGIASVPWGIQDTLKHLGKWYVKSMVQLHPIFDDYDSGIVFVC